MALLSSRSRRTRTRAAMEPVFVFKVCCHSSPLFRVLINQSFGACCTVSPFVGTVVWPWRNNAVACGVLSNSDFHAGFAEPSSGSRRRGGVVMLP